MHPLRFPTNSKTLFWELVEKLIDLATLAHSENNKTEHYRDVPPPIHSQPIFRLRSWWFCPSIYCRSANRTNGETHLTSEVSGFTQEIKLDKRMCCLLCRKVKWKKEGTKEGSKERKQLMITVFPNNHSFNIWANTVPNCMQKLFKVLRTQSVSETLRCFPYRVCRSKVVVFNHWWFCPPGDIWQFLGIFLVVTTKSVIGIQWVKVKKVLLDILQCTWQLPAFLTKYYLVKNVKRAETEKSWPRGRK